jgi:hypothetical protein
MLMTKPIATKIENEKMTFKEYLKLIALNIAVKKRNFVEFIKVISKYYGNSRFRQADTDLLKQYVFESPYVISKSFLVKKGEENIYAYGETPLTTLDAIVRQCEITSKDVVYELGCGRGRCCFWLNCFLNCKVVGIEYIPLFIEKANRVKTAYQFDNIEFRLGDILEEDYSGATVLYLYGTCYDASFLKKLLKKLSSLPAGAKIITVSYPLSDYSADYEVMKRFPVKFTWGMGDVYLQIKR